MTDAADFFDGIGIETEARGGQGESEELVVISL